MNRTASIAILLSIAACGKSAPDAKPTTTGDDATPEPQPQEYIDGLGALVDELCACKDQACLDAYNHKLGALQRRTQFSRMTLTKDQERRENELAGRSLLCHGDISEALHPDEEPVPEPATIRTGIPECDRVLDRWLACAAAPTEQLDAFLLGAAQWKKSLDAGGDAA